MVPGTVAFWEGNERQALQKQNARTRIIIEDARVVLRIFFLNALLANT
jgi:hypothetical protein